MTDALIKLATWNLYYSARDTYGPLVGLADGEPLDAVFWHKVTEAFEANDTAFQQYQTFTTRGVGVKPCNLTCKAGVICDLRTMRSEDSCVSFSLACCEHSVINSMQDLTPKVQLQGGIMLNSSHGDHCEGMNIRHITSNIPSELVRALCKYRRVQTLTGGHK